MELSGEPRPIYSRCLGELWVCDFWYKHFFFNYYWVPCESICVLQVVVECMPQICWFCVCDVVVSLRDSFSSRLTRQAMIKNCACQWTNSLVVFLVTIRFLGYYFINCFINYLFILCVWIVGL